MSGELMKGITKDFIVDGIVSTMKGMEVNEEEIRDKFEEIKKGMHSLPKGKAIMLHITEDGEVELIILEKSGMSWNCKEDIYNISEIAEETIERLVG